MIFAAIFIALIEMAARVRFASGDDAVKGPLIVAHCRAQCLDKFMSPGWTPEDAVCQRHADCYMCWESCDLLNQNFAVWGSMCGHDQICFSGCQQSCSFFIDHVAARSPGTTTMRFPGALSIESEGDGTLKMDWPAAIPVSDARNSISGDGIGNTVYLILRRSRNSDSKHTTTRWQQVAQTSEQTTTLQLPSSSTSSGLELKVLAVTGSGAAGQIAATWAQMPRDDWGGKTRPLRLRLLALRRKGNDAEAVVTWAAPGVTDVGGAFVITWEAREGSASVSGHMVSELTVASIPLRSSKVYSVRVEAVSGPAISAGRSEPLIIDAGSNLAVNEDDNSAPVLTGECQEVPKIAIYITAVVAASIAVAGIVAIVWICQRDKRRIPPPETTRRPVPPPLRLKHSTASIIKSPAPRVTVVNTPNEARLYPSVFAEPRLSTSHLERFKQREQQVFDWNLVLSPKTPIPQQQRTTSGSSATDPIASSDSQKSESQRTESMEKSPRSPSMEFLLVGEIAESDHGLFHDNDDVASVAQSLPPDTVSHFVPKRKSRRIMSTHV